MYLLTYLNHD